MTSPRLSATERFQEYMAASTVLQKVKAAAEYGMHSSESLASSTNATVAATRANWVDASAHTTLNALATLGQAFATVRNIAPAGAGISYSSNAVQTFSPWQQDAASASLQLERIANRQYEPALDVPGSTVIFGSYDAADLEERGRSDAIRFLESQTILSFGREIAQRLDELIRAAHEEGSEPSSLGSLWGLCRLLIEFPHLKKPSIVLTPGGSIYARWQDDHERLFGVRIINENKARFVVIRPNPGFPEVEEQFSGETTLDNLLTRAISVGGLDWAFEHER